MYYVRPNRARSTRRIGRAKGLNFNKVPIQAPSLPETKNADAHTLTLKTLVNSRRNSDWKSG